MVDGVGEQGEALGSDVLVVGSASGESAVVGEEQLTAEGVEGFTLQTDAFCTFTKPTPPWEASLHVTPKLADLGL